MAAPTLLNGHDMATVWLIRHYFYTRGFKCSKREECDASTAGISVHQKATKIRCGHPSTCIVSLQKAVKEVEPSHFLALGYYESTAVLAYVFALSSGAQVKLSCNLGRLSKQHAAIINDELAQLAVYHNVMRMSKARDRWAEGQADETAWGQRKYHRGRRQRASGVLWIAGACNVSEGQVRELMARVVKNRTGDVLVPMLTMLARDDGILQTDGWRAYGGLTPSASAEQKKAVTHLTVNHTVGFRDNTTGACTNHIEGMWRVLKYELKRRFGTLGGKGSGTAANLRVQLGIWIVNTNLDRKFHLIREKQRQQEDSARALFDDETVDLFSRVIDPTGEEAGDNGYKPSLFEAAMKLLMANYREVDVDHFDAAKYLVKDAMPNSSDDDGGSDLDVCQEFLDKCRVTIRDQAEVDDPESDNEADAQPAAPIPEEVDEVTTPEHLIARPLSEAVRARADARAATKRAKEAQKAAAKAATEVARAAKAAKKAEDKAEKLETAAKKTMREETAKRSQATGVAKKRTNTTTKKR
jgi:hypothetical protein